MPESLKLCQNPSVSEELTQICSVVQPCTPVANPPTFVYCLEVRWIGIHVKRSMLKNCFNTTVYLMFTFKFHIHII